MRTWARRSFFGTDSLETLNQCGIEDTLIDQSGDQLRECAWRDRALKVSGFSSPAYACANPAARQAERSATTSARLSGGRCLCDAGLCTLRFDQLGYTASFARSVSPKVSGVSSPACACHDPESRHAARSEPCATEVAAITPKTMVEMAVLMLTVSSQKNRSLLPLWGDRTSSLVRSGTVSVCVKAI